MIPLTLANAVGLFLVLFGALFTANGFRHAFVDEVAIGGLLLLGAWWLVAL